MCSSWVRVQNEESDTGHVRGEPPRPRCGGEWHHSMKPYTQPANKNHPCSLGDKRPSCISSVAEGVEQLTDAVQVSHLRQTLPRTPQTSVGFSTLLIIPLNPSLSKLQTPQRPSSVPQATHLRVEAEVFLHSPFQQVSQDFCACRHCSRHWGQSCEQQFLYFLEG